MSKTPPRLSPEPKSRSWAFYAIVTFAITLLVVGAIVGIVYLVPLAIKRTSRVETYGPGAASAASRQFKPATFDGVGWKIEAEDYDEGGEGVGWHDLFPGNILYEHEQNPALRRPGEYRKDDVEIMSKNPGQLNVGFVLKGEWLVYTIDVPATGMYDLELNVAAMHPGRRISFELDGERLPETVILPVTGDWARFEEVTMPGGIRLTRGKHKLAMVFDEPYMNVDWLRFTPRNTDGGRSP